MIPVVDETVIEAGALSMLLMQFAKWVGSKITKNPAFGFQPIVYAVGIPLLNALMPLFMFFALGLGTNVLLAVTAQEFVQFLLRTAVASLVSFVAYNAGVKPQVEAQRAYKALNS
jgi:hypothetical protein